MRRRRQQACQLAGEGVDDAQALHAQHVVPVDLHVLQSGAPRGRRKLQRGVGAAASHLHDLAAIGVGFARPRRAFVVPKVGWQQRLQVDHRQHLACSKWWRDAGGGRHSHGRMQERQAGVLNRHHNWRVEQVQCARAANRAA